MGGPALTESQTSISVSARRVFEDATVTSVSAASPCYKLHAHAANVKQLLFIQNLFMDKT